jgi:RNA polymerase sigma-B factor
MTSPAIPITSRQRTSRLVNSDADPATRIALERFAATRDIRVRDQLLQRFDRVVQWVVNREAREPGHVEDLMQVGRLALWQALDRYEPARGVRFTSYAVKIITGNLKHHYRDRVSTIRVPRPVQELAAQLPLIQEELTHRLGRQPTEGEIAEFAGVPESEVREAARAGDAYKPQSLDEKFDDRSVAESVGGVDEDIEAMVEFAPLHRAISRLEERQQFIVRRRYFDLWSQSRVADSLGMSQMHVSRLEREGLKKLRSYLGADATTGYAMAN